MLSNSNKMQTPESSYWYALRVKARSEKWVQDRLEKLGIFSYVPINEYTRMYARKIRKVAKPLITGYVFVFSNQKRFSDIFQIPYTGKFISEFGIPAVIPVSEIDLLKRITGEVIGQFELSDSYTVGDMVEVISGNLAGIKARVLDIKGKKRIIVSLDSIAMGLEIHVDPSHVQKVLT